MHTIFIYTFIVRYLQLVQLRQTSYKRQAAANAAALLSTVGNVVVKNVQGIWRAGLNWSEGRSLVTPVLVEESQKAYFQETSNSKTFSENSICSSQNNIIAVYCRE